MSAEELATTFMQECRNAIVALVQQDEFKKIKLWVQVDLNTVYQSGGQKTKYFVIGGKRRMGGAMTMNTNPKIKDLCTVTLSSTFRGSGWRPEPLDYSFTLKFPPETPGAAYTTTVIDNSSETKKDKEAFMFAILNTIKEKIIPIIEGHTEYHEGTLDQWAALSRLTNILASVE